MGTKHVLLGLMAAGMVGGSGYWAFGGDRLKAPQVHVLIGFDVSDSMVDHDSASLVRGITERALQTPGLRKGSKIFVSLTGSEATAMEPVGIGAFGIPARTKVMEGVGASDLRRAQLVTEVLEQFQSRAKETKHSPLFLLLSRGVAQLRAAGCDGQAICRLYLRTDGEETEEPWLRDSLRRKRVVRDGAPRPLDNRGITITICGFSETRGDVVQAGRRHRLTPTRSATSVELLSSVWRKVFTEPGSVVFEPFCPRSEKTLPASPAPLAPTARFGR